MLLGAPGAEAAALPPNFQESAVITGLGSPTVIRWAPDGRIFVAEQRGTVKEYDSVADTTPTQVVDIRDQVHNFWDRGLLGLAVDPQFTTGNPYVYVFYTRDAPLGGTTPTWNDACPSPPGPTSGGCVVSGRLSRFHVNLATNQADQAEQVLIDDWCQQFPSHSAGTLAFDSARNLYASAGDGADFFRVDWGQFGSPPTTPNNPCGDPPSPAGTALTSPTAEGGALRSQDLRTGGDPTGLDGSLIRINPDTGAPAAGNPTTTGDTNARRILAYGFRNPFRFTIDAASGELWLGDVGAGTWEEINRLPTPAAGVRNFGWPCYQGTGAYTAYSNASLNLCSNLYASGSALPPYFSYNHSAEVVAGEPCPTGSSSITGMRFYPSGPYPAVYDGALFFADYTRSCIWAMFEGANGLPDPNNIITFASGDPGPTDVAVGPDGNVYYANFDGGKIMRVQYFPNNQPPIARATASSTSGVAPLDVRFDGSTSSEPDAGDSLTYAWDLDGDGEYDDSDASRPSWTYEPGTTTVRLKVTDKFNAFSVSAPITIVSNDTPPTAQIDTPAAGLRWSVGDQISFTGSATDAQAPGGTLDGSSMEWELVMRHCPSNCHAHGIQGWDDVAGGSFAAPDHEYPSHLELTLTVTDSAGLEDSETIELQPNTASLALTSSPSGRSVSLDETSGATPLTATVIAGSSHVVSTPTTQTEGDDTYHFTGWSDGGAASHTVSVGASDRTISASFDQAPRAAVAPSVSGAARDGETLTAGDGSWVGTSPISFSRRWQRCDGRGADCRDVVGATGASLRLGAGDVGSTLRVVVAADNATPGTVTKASSLTAPVVARAPASTTAPRVSGGSRVGQTLTASDGTWSGTAPVTVTRSWRRCNASGNACRNIARATGSRHVLVAADAGHMLRVAVRARNGGGESTATSAATARIRPLGPAVNLAVSWAAALRGRVSLTLSCPTQACRTTARGSLAIPGRRRPIALGPVRRRLARAKRAHVRLTLSRAERRALAAALARDLTVAATVTLTARDARGNASSTRRTASLRG